MGVLMAFDHSFRMWQWRFLEHSSFPAPCPAVPGRSSSLLSSQPSAHSLLQEQKVQTALLHYKRRLEISWMDVSRSRLVFLWCFAFRGVWSAIPMQSWDIFPSIWEALKRFFKLLSSLKCPALLPWQPCYSPGVSDENSMAFLTEHLNGDISLDTFNT